MIKLTLWFSGEKKIGLEKTSFRHPLPQRELLSIRGKTCGAFDGYETFQWTPAVQAFTILSLRSAALLKPAPLLEGEHGSPASSLDYALGKMPRWMFDMFGTDSQGRPLVKRLIRRTNPERKRPGPVVLALNDKLIRPEEIQIFLNKIEIRNPKALLEMAAEIEAYWKGGSSNYSRPR